ncbi:hypothetical protein TthSNM11_00780 [Thermus thermophilus]|nr:hypothetical protein TthSNM11_00780 [Thermus thermophilus]
MGEGGGVLGIRLGHLLQEEGPGPVQKGQDLLQGKAPFGPHPLGGLGLAVLELPGLHGNRGKVLPGRHPP